MSVRQDGQKRYDQFVRKCAAFAFVIIIYAAVPAYSSGIGSVNCFSVVTIEPGQNLDSLAKKYGTTRAQILEDNPYANQMSPGETLTIRENVGLRDNSRTPEISRGTVVAYQWPAGGRISSEYGRRGDKEFHHGIDIAVNTGTTISAARSGKVVKTGWMGVYGLTVLIDHGNGFQTLYAHNDQVLVKAGEQVRTGEPIALSGNTGNTTGPHLHFEIRKNGQALNPADFLTAY